MKLIVLFACVFIYIVSGAENAPCGSSAEACSWSVDSDGKLTITGNGDMNDYTWEDTAPWYSLRESIKEVIIQNGIKSIGQYAFFQLNSVETITISSSVTSIKEYAFESYDAIIIIYKGTQEPTCENNYEIYQLVLVSDENYSSDTFCSKEVTRKNAEGNYVFSGDCGTGVTYILDVMQRKMTINGNGPMTDFDYENDIIPPWSEYSNIIKSIEMSGITSIGNYAFESCYSLTSITIPSSVTSIGNSVFGSCTSLTSITAENNNPNYSSDTFGVLFNKDKTELIQYPAGNSRNEYSIPSSVRTIGSYAFFSCTLLTSITIPTSVTSIKSYAFQGTQKLTSITIPNSITKIESYAFYNCDSLTSITIPEGVTSIGDNAFSGCYSLTSITIPSSVTSIGKQAFYRSSLTSVTILSSIITINSEAFAYISRLQTVTFNGLQYPLCGFAIFGGVVNKLTINVPPEYDSYTFCSAEVTKASTDNENLKECGEYTNEVGTKTFYCTCVTGTTTDGLDENTNNCECDEDNYYGNEEKTECIPKIKCGYYTNEKTQTDATSCTCVEGTTSAQPDSNNNCHCDSAHKGNSEGTACLPIVKCGKYTNEKGEYATECTCVEGTKESGLDSNYNCECDDNHYGNEQHTECLPKMTCGDYTTEKGSKKQECSCVAGTKSNKSDANGNCECDGDHYGNEGKTTCTAKTVCGDYTTQKGTKQEKCTCVEGATDSTGSCACDNDHYGNEQHTACLPKMTCGYFSTQKGEKVSLNECGCVGNAAWDIDMKTCKCSSGYEGNFETNTCEQKTTGGTGPSEPTKTLCGYLSKDKGQWKESCSCVENAQGDEETKQCKCSSGYEANYETNTCTKKETPTEPKCDGAYGMTFLMVLILIILF